MSTFGSNLGYVDELYARFLEDPSSVGDVWREFFAGYRPSGPAVAPEPPAPAAPPAPAMITLRPRSTAVFP